MDWIKAGRPRLILLLALLMLASIVADAQYVSPYVTLQGTLSTSSGLAAKNATLTFSPSQVFFVAGSSMVVQESQCGTDANGAVVGVGNPVLAPRGTPQFVGTLPPGNYYIEFAWYDQFGIQTLASPETVVQLTHTGELQILPPVGTGPPQASGMAVYIGLTPGGETLQGTTTSLTAQFTQASALNISSAVPQIRNLTACRVIANDTGFPTGTGYNVGLLDASGNTLFAYPEMWQFFGPGSTYNLSQGIPYYHGQVTYPIPILTIPYNHNAQSISGPLSLSGYNLYNVGAVGVGTSTPAWGVDVEGPGLDAEINAKGGYLVNGSGGTEGECLGSDGTAFDTPIACGLPTLYYQTIYQDEGAFTQRPALNFAAQWFTINDSASPAQTVINLATTGTEAELVTAAGAGASGKCVQWDASGGIVSSGAACGLGSAIQKNCLTTTCAGGSVYTLSGTYTNSLTVPLSEQIVISAASGEGCTTLQNHYFGVVVNGSTMVADNWSNNAANTCLTYKTYNFTVPPSGTWYIVQTEQNSAPTPVVVSYFETQW